MIKQLEDIHFTIDGTKVTAKPQSTIKEAAAQAGVKIPSLCHLSGREDSDQPCLICMVEADGNMVRSCRTQIESGMKVKTSTPAIAKHRKQRLEHLISFHYGDCKAPCNLTCPAGINVQGYINYIARGNMGQL